MRDPQNGYGLRDFEDLLICISLEADWNIVEFVKGDIVHWWIKSSLKEIIYLRFREGNFSKEL